MKRQLLTVTTVVISMTIVLIMTYLLAQSRPDTSGPALAAPLVLAVTEANPSYAPNDLDTLVTINGTDFVSVPMVYLENTALSSVEWVSSTVLRATVPWGMNPGVYTLTVENPGGDAASLSDAFTVTEGIGVWNAGAFYGGKVDQIVINPLTPTTLYAVSKHAGVFRSRDGGSNWSLKIAGMSGIIRILALDPLAPNRLYLFESGRSEDEGDTWTPLDIPGEGQALKAFPHPYITGTVYASSHFDFLSGGCGFWKSTDSGGTWTTITATVGLTDTCVAAVAFHPTYTQTLVAGTKNGNIFRSTDAGDTWAFASGSEGVVNALAFNPFAANEVWVSGRYFGATLRNANEGYSAWTAVGEPVGSLGYEDIAFAPLGWGEAFSQTVFVAGPERNAHKSTDGGETWDSFGPQAQVLDIGLHPTAPNVIYASTTCGGVYKTLNGGATWQQVNQGLTAMAPSGLATVPDRPDMVYATVEGCEGIFQGTRGGSTWQFLEVEGATIGPQAALLVDPYTTTRLYLGGYGTVYRSDDGGQTWPISGTLPTPDECVDSDDLRIEPNALQADPSEPGTLLVGASVGCHGASGWIEIGEIYRSSDGGQAWATTLTPTQVINPVEVLAYDHLTPTIVYAGSGCDDKDGEGVLWKSIDGGQSWQALDMPALEAGGRINSLATEQDPPYRLFAGISSESEHCLYFSADHGESWQKPPAPLHGSVKPLHFAPGNPPVLYASAWPPGLVRSTDGARTWTPVDGTLGQVTVYELASVGVDDRVCLYAGTTGGYVESGGAQTLSIADNGGTLVSAGVYRYTTRRSWEVYLPLVVRNAP